MTNIQKARDVLAKWRGHALTGNWSIIPLPLSHNFDMVDGSMVYAANTDDGTAARLIVGTAGNPDLLDALDELLRLEAAVEQRGGPVFANTKRIAAAIIAAEGKGA